MLPKYEAVTVRHYVQQVWLENYRNYESVRLEIAPNPVIIRGPNGAGKTNLLEALSLLAPGRGLRGAKLSEMNPLHVMQSGENGAGFVVSAQAALHDETYQIGTAYQLSAAGRDQRLVQVNGEKLAKQAALTEYVNLLWLTPAMDQLFVSGHSERRKWLDRLVFVFDAAHAARVSMYEQAMRERSQLLKQFQTPDPAWLSILERSMAEAGVAIVIARQEAVARIAAAIQVMPGIFPKAELWLEGDTETLLFNGKTALEAEDALANQLCQNRAADAASGRALKGVHKTLFQVKHLGKNMAVEYGSTGEQKAMLLCIVIATALAREKWVGAAPILLLDEVVAHLDVEKQHCLFDLVAGAGIQAWLTGTDASDFSDLAPYATVLEVANGRVSQQG